MNAKALAEQIKSSVKDLKSKGFTSISCDDLIGYLDRFNLEDEKGPENDQLWIETTKLDHASRLEQFRSVITMGQNAIKTSAILHGGAAVTLFALAGNLAHTQESIRHVAVLSNAVIPFAIGVLCSGLVSLLAYLVQWLDSMNEPFKNKLAYRLNLGCIALGATSYMLFAWGIYRASQALLVIAKG